MRARLTGRTWGASLAQFTPNPGTTFPTTTLLLKPEGEAHIIFLLGNLVFFNFTYSESKEREEKQKALVSKFFQKEQQTKQSTKAARAMFETMSAQSSSQVQSSSKVTTSSMSMSSSSSVTTTQQVSKVEHRSALQIEEARKAGEERKMEAKKRREEFVVKQSEAKLMSNVKSTQELHKEREDMIAREVLKIQEESRKMMERYLDDSKRRADMLQKEQVNLGLE